MTEQINPVNPQPITINTPTNIRKPGGIKVAQGLFLISALLISLIIFPGLFIYALNSLLYPELLNLQLVVFAGILILSWSVFFILFWKNWVVEVIIYLMVVLLVLPSLLFIPTIIGTFVLVIDVLIVIAVILVYKNRSYFRNLKTDLKNQSTT